MSEQNASHHKAELDQFMTDLAERNPGESEFHQAVQEVASTLIPYINENPEYREARILERLTEPDRVVIFRVTWEDDNGDVQVNRAWRVQFNNSIGPYKGGMRFHPEVTLSVLKFLGFEQTLKNSLTTLPMGGAKGGSNFDPKGRSDREVMRFCQALMTELQRHIGEDTDIPAGDIGVGAREIGFLFGQQKRISGRFTGTMTGKGLAFGGSAGRTAATGYGAVYFMDKMLSHAGHSIEEKRCVVSGSGNVALYTIEKLEQLGAIAITASDSDGFIHDPDGITGDRLDWLKDLKENRRGRISEYADEFGCEYHEGEKPWGTECDLAFPSATQNELGTKGVKQLIDNGVLAVAEGANMPTELDAITDLQESNVLFAPAKAANAGGVAVSGLEQSQNSLRIFWTSEEVDSRLQEIMGEIHEKCVEYGGCDDAKQVDYVAGANIAGFKKVADAMLAYGHI